MVPVFRAHVEATTKRLRWAPASQALLARYLGTLGDRDVDVVITVHRERRSSQANRFYFGVVVALIAEHCGYDRDEMHELLAMKFLRREDDPVTGAPRRQRTPQANTRDFSVYVDACIRFAATELGVDIPPAGTVAGEE